jgi:hypothetical protein
MSGARSGAWSPCRWTRGRRASSSHIPRRIRAPRSCSCPLKSLPSRRANPQIEPAAPAARFGATFGPPAPPIELRAGAAPICRREGLDTDAERGSGELKGAGFNGRAGSKKPRSTVLIQPHHTSRPNPNKPDPGAVRTDRPRFPSRSSESTGERGKRNPRDLLASAGARKAKEGYEQGKKQEGRRSRLWNGILWESKAPPDGRNGAGRQAANQQRFCAAALPLCAV